MNLQFVLIQLASDSRQPMVVVSKELDGICIGLLTLGSRQYDMHFGALCTVLVSKQTVTRAGRLARCSTADGGQKKRLIRSW